MQNVALVQIKVNRLGGKINMHSWLTWIGDGRVNPALLISAMISAATTKLYKLNLDTLENVCIN